ncbi:MAG: MerR family transcriptional regulator [Chloroflexota bacterium]|nr:MerR family transcriptional regulator [Chloroflexota bacterium]
MAPTNDDRRERPERRGEDRAAARPRDRRPATGGSPEAAPESVGRSPVHPETEDGMSLGALTKAADVSTRTVRYYIAEGLLPPPTGAGPRSAYTQGHLDRLRLIGRLKDAYLPLREIRRRLDALTDDEVRRLLRTLEEEDRPDRPPGLLAAPPAPRIGEAPPDSAAAYLARVRRRNQDVTEPRAPRARSLADEAAPEAPDAGPAFWMAAEMEEAPNEDAVLGAAVLPAPPAAPAESRPPETNPDAWRRVPLGDDAELLIRESVYRRKRDRVEWLAAWARRVFR